MNNLDALIERYVEAVIFHGQESWGGDHKKANQNYHAYTECFIEICRDREGGPLALRQLLSHSSQFMRYAAAYHILPLMAKRV